MKCNWDEACPSQGTSLALRQLFSIDPPGFDKPAGIDQHSVSESNDGVDIEDLYYAYNFPTNDNSYALT